MSEVIKNPFTPVEMWEDTKVTVEEGDEKKRVDAKYYKIAIWWERAKTANS